MKLENTFYNISNRGCLALAVSTPVFLFYRESFRILPKLIISSLNQRLTIELFKTTERTCNELTVLSCDLNIILKVVSGYGMPLIVIKSI
jgi:hypothetical protein